MAQTSWTGLLAGSSTPLLATGDVMAWVDISDTTQSPSGSLVKTTVAAWYAALPSAVNITSASAVSLAVGRQGSTTPAFTVDSSTASQVAGLKVTGAATGGTVAVVVTDSGSDANLTINALGTGTIGIGSVSTGRVTIAPVTTITGSLTLSAALVYGGVTLSNSVTGTGSMVLSASPTLTGTLTAASAALTGTLTVTTTSASGLAVGRQGATDPVLQVDASTASVATGIKITGAAAASGVAVAVISSGTNENLTVDAKGSGTITIAGTSTGAITLARDTIVTGILKINNSASGVGGAGDVIVPSGSGIRGLNIAGTNIRTGVLFSENAMTFVVNSDYIQFVGAIYNAGAGAVVKYLRVYDATAGTEYRIPFHAVS